MCVCVLEVDVGGGIHRRNMLRIAAGALLNADVPLLKI